MRQAQQVQKALTRLLESALVVLMGSLVVVVFLQVFSRYVLSSSISWTEELARYLLIYLTLLGGGLAIHERTHLRVDLFQKKLPAKPRKVLGLLINLSMLGTAGVIFYFGLMYTVGQWGALTPALVVSIGWFYAALPAMGFIMIVYLIPQIIGQVLGWDENDYQARPDTQPNELDEEQTRDV